MRRVRNEQADESGNHQSGKTDDEECGAPAKQVVDPAAEYQPQRAANRYAEGKKSHHQRATIQRKHSRNERVSGGRAARLSGGDARARREKLPKSLSEAA